MSKILFSRSRCRQVSSASPDAEPGRGLLLPALPPAPGLPVPGAEHGQGLPRPPHGVLGQHHGPEGKQPQPVILFLTEGLYRKDLFSCSFRVEN